MSTKTPEELAEIQNLTLAEFGDALAGLDADDLAALKALEQAETRPRSGALDAIDTAASVLPSAQPPAATPPVAPTSKSPAPVKPSAGDTPEDDANAIARDGAAKEAPAEANTTADWQKPDYTGPLDIERAEWRRVNLKPVDGVATK